MALFYFLVKHAPGFPIPALRRNRSANSRGSPPGLAAAIPVLVFSGHFAVAAGIAEAGGDALTVEETAAATVAEIVAVTAAIAAPIGDVEEDALNGGPEVAASIAAAGLGTAIPAATGIRGVRN